MSSITIPEIPPDGKINEQPQGTTPTTTVATVADLIEEALGPPPSRLSRDEMEKMFTKIIQILDLKQIRQKDKAAARRDVLTLQESMRLHLEHSRHLEERLGGEGSAPPSEPIDPTIPPKEPSQTHAPAPQSIDALVERIAQRTAEIVSSKLATTDPTPPTPHAATPAPPLPNVPPPWPRVPTKTPEPPSPKELTVVINVSKTDRASRIKSWTHARLAAQVDTAIENSGVSSLKGIRVRGVRKLPNGNLEVQAQSEANAEALQLHADRWMNLFDENAKPLQTYHRIVAHAVPLSFNPAAEGARQTIYNENAGTIPTPESIINMQWINPHRKHVGGKRESSLILTILSGRATDELMYRSLVVAGAICRITRYIPGATQCFRCQAYNHIAKACPHKHDPLTLKCARCAGNHATKDCECPASTKCADIRSCTHIVVKCANCDGNHKSLDSACPVKAAATAEVHARHPNPTSYFDPTFTPRAVSAGRY